MDLRSRALQYPSKCYIATKNGELLGFACFDVTAKGFFGPIGVLETQRGNNIGSTLLIKTLESMKECGYGYGIIAWVSDAAEFYKKTVNAKYIEGGEPENSIYSNLIFMK